MQRSLCRGRAVDSLLKMSCKASVRFVIYVVKPLRPFFPFDLVTDEKAVASVGGINKFQSEL